MFLSSVHTRWWVFSLQCKAQSLCINYCMQSLGRQFHMFSLGFDNVLGQRPVSYAHPTHSVSCSCLLPALCSSFLHVASHSDRRGIACGQSQILICRNLAEAKMMPINNLCNRFWGTNRGSLFLRGSKCPKKNLLMNFTLSCPGA